MGFREYLEEAKVKRTNHNSFTIAIEYRSMRFQNNEPNKEVWYTTITPEDSGMVDHEIYGKSEADAMKKAKDWIKKNKTNKGK